MSLNNINGIFNRINDIEQKFNPEVREIKKEQSFQEALSGLQNQSAMRVDYPQFSPMAGAMAPAFSLQNNYYLNNSPGPVNSLKPLAQSNSVSCGQTSVAMAVNSLTGKNLTDMDINGKYGFQLLNALNSETASQGIKWRDGGNISPYSWGLIEQKVNMEKTPVIVALNGPEFSPSGRGHIVTIVKIQGDTVSYADPATGEIKTTTKKAMETAPTHPDGNFIFFAERNTGQFIAPA
ncbi:MAG TPA: hypothetical protein PL110_11815 [Candidatus Eremiobacteraeota bacterium]|nr:MAG: hypothetical protein BWY64_01792 [bacterium ADurb.Bin363]HPZ08795.1 hypothetical protein [Candidatus Eremiobacteraeota bacterium]